MQRRAKIGKPNRRLRWQSSVGGIVQAVVTFGVFGLWVLLAIFAPETIRRIEVLVIVSSGFLGGFFYAVVHETGHALAVRWRRGEVVSIQVGAAPFLSHLRIGDIPVRIGAWLGVGRVEYVSPYETRIDRALVASAGMVGDACLLAIVMTLGGLADAYSSPLVLIFEGLTLTGVVTLVVNALPRKARGRRIGTDGYEIWRALSGR